MRRKILGICLLGALLSSCMGPIPANSSSTYVLNTIPSHIPKKPQQAGTILVLTPDTQPAYDTTRMAYTAKPYQLAYFGLNQWAETPSQMLLPLIVQSLQNTHHFHAVAAPPYLGRYQYALTTRIIKLQQNYVRCPQVVEFTLRAQITRLSTNQVIATKQFSVTTPIRQKTPYGGVLAANNATGKLLAELTNFCLDNT